MSSKNNYVLQCEEIVPGAFSGEESCQFRAYDRNSIVHAELPAPSRYTNQESKTVRVRVAGVQEDRVEVYFPIAGSGDFERITVPSTSLVDLAQTTA
ncbi:hypothetical protein HN604_00510 [archaeon]|jgi:hypothetical protein|nr:hypothetical protein [archaeon]MBT6182980.1 hypothetical protein [archaeon]MBT6606637.1 hypothetical protein [archaeon]MBT7251880.1 hypothetical protein [archaeon]MBT7660548.1 hypothetical protein [archaeon]